MNIFSVKNALLCLVVVLTAVFVIKLHRFYLTEAELRDTAPQQQNNKPIPADVEAVLHGYSYTQTGDDLVIRISGQQMVRRGRKMLGLRSNIIKTNFLQYLNGALTTPKSKISFSASEAEWDANQAHPLILTGVVSVTIDNKHLDNIKSAEIFFKQGVIEIRRHTTEVYNFR